MKIYWTVAKDLSHFWQKSQAQDYVNKLPIKMYTAITAFNNNTTTRKEKLSRPVSAALVYIQYQRYLQYKLRVEVSKRSEILKYTAKILEWEFFSPRINSKKVGGSLINSSFWMVCIGEIK